MKKVILILGLLLLSSSLFAGGKRYYVHTAVKSDPLTARLALSEKKDEGAVGNGTGCRNDFHDYLKSEYDDYYLYSGDAIGPYDSYDKAKKELRRIKGDYRSNGWKVYVEDFYCRDD